MRNRLLKQFLYGSIYLLIFGFVAYNIYFAVIPEPSCFDNRRNQNEEEVDCGGQCASCEIRRLKPIEVLPTLIFPADGNRSLALLELRNPNAAWGAENFQYVFKVFDAQGKELSNISGQSFIYSGDSKHLVEVNLPLDSKMAARSEVVISDLSWKRRDEFPRPKITIKTLTTKTERRQILISSNIANEELFGYPEVQIIGVGVDKTGRRIAASKTVLQEIKPNEERFFQLTFPALADLDLKLTKIFVEAKR